MWQSSILGRASLILAFDRFILTYRWNNRIPDLFGKSLRLGILFSPLKKKTGNGVELDRV